jgi:hypothetical protein
VFLAVYLLAIAAVAIGATELLDLGPSSYSRNRDEVCGLSRETGEVECY